MKLASLDCRGENNQPDTSGRCSPTRATGITLPSPFLVPDVSGDVVGEIGHADFHSRSGDADGSHEQAHPGFLVSEDVLDAGSDF